MHYHAETILAAALTLLFGAAAFAGGLEPAFKGLPKIELSFDLAGQQPDWKLESQDEDSARYGWQGYALDVRVDKNGTQRLLRFTLCPPDGQKLSVNSYGARAVLQVAGLSSVMVPNIRPIGGQLGYYHQHKKWRENVPLYRCLIPDSFEEFARANTDAPFILLTDNKGNNKFSIGWAAANTATMLKGAEDGGNYVLTLTRREDQPFSGAKLEDAVIISSSRRPWIDVERHYAKAFDKFNGRRHAAPPKWATEPQFCTWYCYLEHINEDLILRSARKCRDLGIGVFVIDAGWDARPGGWWGDLDNGTIGDFLPASDRFPDLAGTVKKMRDMGLRVILWTAPFWQARQSRIYLEKTKDWHVWTDEGERYELCPKHPGTRKLFRERFERIARDFGVDGMWLDVADSVPEKCVAKHEHLDQTMGEAWMDCMLALHDGLRAVNPEAITEARILHANINGKAALDVVQCGDSPETYEMIRLANIHIRPWAYDVVLKTDPAIWPKNSDAATVGKYLATIVCSGVPDLSVDFLTATDQELKMTKSWLAFYNEHKKTLLKGKFKLFGADYGIPDMALIGDREAVVYMKNPKTTEVPLPRSIRRIILLNCTDSDKLELTVPLAEGRYTAQAYAPDWSKSGLSSDLAGSGKTRISHRVPQGGALELR